MKSLNPDASVFYVYELFVEGEANPFYIGKGKGKRRYDHASPSSLKARSYKNHIIKKALNENRKIKVRIVEKDLSQDAAFCLEKKMIAHYGRRDMGTGCLANHTDGGDGVAGVVIDETFRQRQRDRMLSSVFYKSRGFDAPEYRKKLSNGMRESWSKNLERKKSLADANRTRVWTQEMRMKKSRSQMIPEEDYKKRLFQNNPIVRIVRYHISSDSKKAEFECFMCGQKFISWRNNTSRGVMPSEHTDCKRKFKKLLEQNSSPV